MRDWDELSRTISEEERVEILREWEGLIPTPGSPSAVAQGCTCPVYDNAHGAGRGKDEHGRVVYVRDWDCPLHGTPYKRNYTPEIATKATG